jgi:hypothetical protein
LRVTGGSKSRWAERRVMPRGLRPPRPPTDGRQGAMSREGEGVERLKDVLRRYRRTRAQGVSVDARPGCVYGMLTREQLEGLAEDMTQLKATLNRIYVSVVLLLVGLVLNTLLERLGVL